MVQRVSISLLLLLLLTLNQPSNVQSAAVSQTPTSRQSLGNSLTLDTCRADGDCKPTPDDDESECISVNRGTSGQSCGPEFPTCRCVPFSGFRSCSEAETSECLDGEVCGRYTPGATGLFFDALSSSFDLNIPFCVSAEAEKTLSDVELLSADSDSPTGNETVIDVTTPFSENGGLIYDTCRNDEDCVDTQNSASCISVNSGFIGEDCDLIYPSCVCIQRFNFDDDGCQEDTDCIVGEVCVYYTLGDQGPLGDFPAIDDLEAGFCVSEEAEKTYTDIEKFPIPSPPKDPTGDKSIVDSSSRIGDAGGLTLASCKGSDNCVTRGFGSLSCETYQPDDVGSYCSEGDTCRCIPFRFTVCKDNTFCAVGEACAVYEGERNTLFTQIPNLDFTQPFCIDVKAAEELEDIRLLATPSPAPPPGQGPGDEDNDSTDDDTDSSDGSGDDDSGDDDSGDDDSGDDDSGDDDSGDGESGDDDSGGNDSTGDDSEGENPEDGDPENAPNEGGESSDDGVCIDARALSHLRTDQLVFKKHVLTKVLCDDNGSCATAGHMVVFDGQPMRMSAYCLLTNCSEKQMYVNSPRYEKKMRVPSRTAKLEYTAFAARYNTRAEEAVLQVAVKMGL